MHVEDLDFENSIVHIRRSVYKHQELAPKTDAGYRDVNVDPKVMKIVKKYVGDRTTGRVFDSKRGTPLVCGDINRYVLKPLLEKLEIKDQGWRPRQGASQRGLARFLAIERDDPDGTE